MSRKIKLKRIDWPGTVAAALLAVALPVFPFVNPCETEDARVCTWKSDTAGNAAGSSFTDFYGLTLYHPTLTP